MNKVSLDLGEWLRNQIGRRSMCTERVPFASSEKKKKEKELAITCLD